MHFRTISFSRFTILFCALFLVIGNFSSCKSDPKTSDATHKIESKTSDTSQNSQSSQLQNLSAEELERQGFQLFNNNPADALPYLKLAADKYLSKGDDSKAAITNSHIGGIYAKNLKENPGALEYTTKSLNLWRSIGNQIQIANQLKDLGIYTARSGDTNNGNNQLNEAIGIFEKLKAKNGIAECKFNLAQIKKMDGDLEGAEKLYLESNDIWLKSGMKTKVFTNNLFGMRLYHQMNDLDKLKVVIDETQKLEDQITMRPHFKQALSQTLRDIQF